MANQKSNSSYGCVVIIILLIITNLFVIPGMRKIVSSVEKQHIAKIPYLPNAEIKLSGQSFIYVGAEKITAFETTKTNNKLWEYSIDSNLIIQEVLTDEKAIYVLYKKFLLQKINSKTGEIEWEKGLPYYEDADLKLYLSTEMLYVKYTTYNSEECYFFDKEGYYIGLPAEQIYVSGADEIREKTRVGVLWDKMDYFEDESLFFEKGTSNIYMLGISCKYFASKDLFILPNSLNSLGINSFSLLRVHKEDNKIRKNERSFSRKNRFRHFEDGFAVFVEPNIEDLRDSSISFLPLVEKGNGYFSSYRWDLGEPNVFHSRGKPFYLKGSYLFIQYRDRILIFDASKYTYNSEEGNYTNHNIIEEINIEEKRWPIIEDFVPSKTHLYIRTNKKEKLKDSGEESFFYYVVPVDFCADNFSQ